MHLCSFWNCQTAKYQSLRSKKWSCSSAIESYLLKILTPGSLAAISLQGCNSSFNPIGSNVYFECLTPEGGSFLPAVFINIFKSFYSLQRQRIDSVVERRLPLKPATRVQFLTVAIFCCKIFSYKSNES